MPLELPSLVDAVGVGLGLLVVVLGLAITFRAYQGFRRNDSRPLLLLAVGMLFITVIPSIVELLVLPFITRYFSVTIDVVKYTIITSRASETFGIGILLYSLHVQRN